MYVTNTIYRKGTTVMRKINVFSRKETFSGRTLNILWDEKKIKPNSTGAILTIEI